MTRHSTNAEGKKELVALGSAIKILRKEISLSQEALADLAGIDRSHMGRIERGERNVTLLNILKVSRALTISLEELFRRAQI